MTLHDVPMPPDHTDSIERGDKVSWRIDGGQRKFGRVIRRTTRNFESAFVVSDGVTSTIVPVKFVTKEVG